MAAGDDDIAALLAADDDPITAAFLNAEEASVFDGPEEKKLELLGLAVRGLLDAAKRPEATAAMQVACKTRAGSILGEAEHLKKRIAALNAVRQMIPPIVEKLASEDPAVQLKAAGDLWKICHADARSKPFIGDAGAMPCLVVLVASANAEVAERACGAIVNLINQCPANKKLLHEAGGEAALTALFCNTQSKSIMNAAIQAINNMVVGTPYGPLMAKPEVMSKLQALAKSGDPALTKPAARPSKTSQLGRSLAQGLENDTNVP
eukprot:CAMPEP_0175917270 /NCGR_PEP_ID=MMETSP0108-20121206/11275_1 /TAXON_ID=195067 ORGANISM="Goniomonas pacifica, Strain CCMP1869" /NCGR_SAMPLE_ID=MMETSP0108 /ASSEMBLY_ACC=CAM_ASM_000204 /LENGTH=263 /DNA_ID=CAMNT_0017239847 /DNA_START=10 /DNA_END=802 /DNA_ORIENTATION=+